MKRLFLILCGALALAACNKTVENSLRTGEDNAEGRIVFRAEQLTKSVTESTASVLQANGFKVAAVTGTTTFFNENVSYVSENAWFETAQTYYYPSVNTNFFAVYPKTEEISIDEVGEATLEYTSDGSTDLIAAKALDVASRETPQPLTFDHILSQVVVKCHGSDANVEYVVKSVTLSNSDAAIYAYSTGAWTGANKAKASAIVSSNTAASTASFTTMGEAVTAIPAEMDLRVTWDCLQGTTVVGSYDETVTFTPTIGKICTVNCTLPNKDAQVIRFTISVNPWGEETQNVVLTSPVSIAVDNTFVESLANVGTKSLSRTDLDIDELVDNLADGSKVNVTLNDGEFSVSTDIEDLDNPESDGGKIYLTSNSEETEGYSYEILYDEDEWKIKSTGYLVFEVITGGKIIWKAYNDGALSLLYSKDNGRTWSEWTSTTSGAAIYVNAGEIIYIKGTGVTLNSMDNYSSFETGTATYYVYGNVNSLINNAELSHSVFKALFRNNASLRSHPTKKIVLPATGLTTQCFYYMFQNCTGLTIAPVLSATTLAQNCYMGMFASCTGLTSAPELIATSLAKGCYSSMFAECTGLASTPELPATVLAETCYAYMFSGCTGLTSAPELPATTLERYCYRAMFSGCTSLTTAPELPATVLKSFCYNDMFRNCSNLSSAPELPAIALEENCYSSMFFGCSKLNYVKALFTYTPGSRYTSGWLSGVSSTGTFVKNSAATWNVTGVSGIPSGWTVETASE